MKEYPRLAETMASFNQNVDKDIHMKLINIDQYMRDLKKHAIHEYKEQLRQEIEIQLLKGKNKKKKKRCKNKTKGEDLQ